MSRHKNTARKVIPWIVLGLVVFMFWALGDSRMPLIFAAFLAYLSHPLVRILEREGWRRPIATLVVFIAIVSPLIVILAVAIPVLSTAISDFIAAFPQHAEHFLNEVDKFVGRFGYSVPVERDEVMTFINQKIQLLSMDFLKSATSTLRSSIVSLSGGILFFLNIVLIPLFFFYVMNDLDIWKDRIRSVIPLSIRPVVRGYGARTNEIFSHYLRGQTIDCLVLAVLYGASLQAVGLPFGWLIGAMTGFFNFIPYLGFGLGFIVATITAMATGGGGTLLIWVVVAMCIVQFLESFVITPRLVGNNVGLSSLDAIIALIIFGNLFGFVGMLIAIPCGALFKEIMCDLRRRGII